MAPLLAINVLDATPSWWGIMRIPAPSLRGRPLRTRLREVAAGAKESLELAQDHRCICRRTHGSALDDLYGLSTFDRSGGLPSSPRVAPTIEAVSVRLFCLGAAAQGPESSYSDARTLGVCLGSLGRVKCTTTHGATSAEM